MSTTSADIGIRLKPGDKWLKKELEKKAANLAAPTTITFDNRSSFPPHA